MRVNCSIYFSRLIFSGIANDVRQARAIDDQTDNNSNEGSDSTGGHGPAPATVAAQEEPAPGVDKEQVRYL